MTMPSRFHIGYSLMLYLGKCNQYNIINNNPYIYYAHVVSIIGCIFSKTHLKKIAKYHTLINKSGNSGNRSIYPLISQQSAVPTFSSFCSHCPHFPCSQTNANQLFRLGFVGKLMWWHVDNLLFAAGYTQALIFLFFCSYVYYLTNDLKKDIRLYNSRVVFMLIDSS